MNGWGAYEKAQCGGWSAVVNALPDCHSHDDHARALLAALVHASGRESHSLRLESRGSTAFELISHPAYQLLIFFHVWRCV